MKKANNILRYLFIIVAFFAAANSFAQADSLQTDTFQVHTINGKAYYIHIVEKGGSLYAIHKKYNVPLAILKNENPSVLDGLSIGEKIFIPVKKNVEYEVKTDGNYINHSVKKKQTLYAISKLYNVRQKDVVAANPDLTQGLKEGQQIRIPVGNIKKEGVLKAPAKGKQYQTHKVNKGETLYSLSKLYSTTVDSLQLVNGGLEQGLREGELIYIPLLISEYNVKSNTDSLVNNFNPTIVDQFFDSIFVDSTIVRKDEYSIALFLPFYLDVNDEQVENRNALDRKSIYPKSKFAIEFYKGVKMALDSVSSDSCKFKLYVFDTNGNDSLRIKELLLNPEISSVDLIIGPLYFNNFKRVAKFAQQNRIPILSPVKQNNKLLLGNSFVFKAIASKSTSVKEFSTLLVDSFKTENLLAVAYSESKEKLLVDAYVKAYNKEISISKDTTLYSTIKVLNISKNIADIITHLHPVKNNVIFVPTSDQTFVTNLFSVLTTKLNQEEYKACKITLLGLEEWTNFENIDLPYFQKLNVHFCSTQFIDEQDSLVSRFVTKFINSEKTYPSHNSFLGFDLAFYLGTTLRDNGSLYTPYSLVNFEGLSINLNFFKTGVESGFENTNSFLLKYDDFVIKRVN